MTFCMFVDCMYYVLRAPRKIGAKPIGLPSLNKVFTYLLYLLTKEGSWNSVRAGHLLTYIQILQAYTHSEYMIFGLRSYLNICCIIKSSCQNKTIKNR